ncbi:MAG: anthranilate phosphoribosyltransferase [bacterium]|nr:anthranilate phosphoribosyltransferase [bacterium]
MRDFSWSGTLGVLSTGSDLSRRQARRAMRQVMGGEATPAQIAGLIVALRMKGETVEEMSGLVEGMLEAAVPADLGDSDPVDIVGTGGDRSGTFNISTTASFVAAGAGVPIAKHGNRSMSSQCGSADVLEALGVVIDLPVEQNCRLFHDTGYAFFLAPVYHPAMRFAGPVRKELGIPTVFNFLGPLSNPAGVRRYALGVSDARMAQRMIRVLAMLGARRAVVFHGEDGLDELTLSGPSVVWRLRDGEIAKTEFVPEDVGLARRPVSDVLGGTVETNTAITRRVLAGAGGPHRDISVLNAAAALLVSGRAATMEEGISVAAGAIDSGQAELVLERVVTRSRELAGG